MPQDKESYDHGRKGNVYQGGSSLDYQEGRAEFQREQQRLRDAPASEPMTAMGCVVTIIFLMVLFIVSIGIFIYAVGGFHSLKFEFRW